MRGHLVHHICFDYPLAYLKYINCYVIAAYMSTYVKFATKYVTHLYAHKR